MIERLSRFLLGLVLLPLTLATLYHLPAIFASYNSYIDSFVLLLLGALLYIVFETVLHRPMRTYVFGHELTHALASMAMGGRVQSFKISKNGGSVTLSKSNLFVALAPYGIPIYTVGIVLLYFALRLWSPDVIDHYRVLFLTAVGFSLAFHLSLTLAAIRQGQPDIKSSGAFVSLVLILLMNGWVLAGLSKILFWDLFSVKEFFYGTLQTQLAIWKWALLKAGEGTLWLLERCDGQNETFLFKLKSFLKKFLLASST